MTKFAQITDYSKRLAISETAIPERYRDDVLTLARQLRRDDLKKGLEALSLDEYKEKAVAIIREKTCLEDVVILAECLKYKHAHKYDETEAGKENGGENSGENGGEDTKKEPKLFSDDWYLNYALTQVQLKNFGVVQSKFEKMAHVTNPCPDSKWAGYTYEEILQMYNDGVNIPQEVIEWAQGQKESDAASYEINENDIEVNTNGENADLNGLEQKLKKYVTEIDNKQKSINQKLEEIKEYKKEIEQIKAKNSSKESELGQLKYQIAELKVLNSKQLRKGLTVAEQAKFQSLKESLQGSSALFETVNNNIASIQTFSAKITDLQTECSDAQNVIQETTNLTTNIAGLAKDSASGDKNINANTSSQISTSGENAIYGVAISELPNVAAKYCTECETTVNTATSFINSCAKLNQFCEKYMMLVQTLGSADDLKLGFSIALPTSSASTAQTAQTAAVSEEAAEEEGNPYGIEEVGSGSAFSVLGGIPTSFLQVAAIIAGVSSYIVAGIVALSALLCATNQETTKKQTGERNTVKQGTDALEAGNAQAINFTDKTTDTVSSLHKLFYDKTKNSDKLMKEMLKLFDDKKDIKKKTEKEKEQIKAKAEAESQKEEAESEQNAEAMQVDENQNNAQNGGQNGENPDQNSEQGNANTDGSETAQDDAANAQQTEGNTEQAEKAKAKEKENEKEVKDAEKTEAKQLLQKDKKIDKITKKVGKFSKEKETIIKKIEKRIPENEKVMQENDAAGKLMASNSENLNTSANYLNLQSIGRKLDGSLNIARAAIGAVASLVVIGMGVAMLFSPWTCALGKKLIWEGTKALGMMGLMGYQGINDVQTANKGLDEVSDSKNQCNNTNSKVGEVNAEDQREAQVIANADDVVKTLTKEGEKSDKDNDKKLKKAQKQEQKDDKAAEKKEKAEEKNKEKAEKAKEKSKANNAAASAGAAPAPAPQAQAVPAQPVSLQEGVQALNENSAAKNSTAKAAVNPVENKTQNNNANSNNNGNGNGATAKPNATGAKANSTTGANANKTTGASTDNATAKTPEKVSAKTTKGKKADKKYASSKDAAKNTNSTGNASATSKTAKTDANKSSDGENSLNETVRKFIYQKLRELGVSKYQLDKVVMPQVNVTGVVNDIKSRVADGADIKDAIEDAMIEEMNSLKIDWYENKKTSKDVYKKEKVKENKDAFKEGFLRKAGMHQNGEEGNGFTDVSASLEGLTVADSPNRPANTNAKVETNTNNVAAKTTDGAGSDSAETETDKTEDTKTSKNDEKDKIVSKRTNNIIAMAQKIKTPDIDTENKKTPQAILKNNISVVSALQDELNELSKNASMNLASSVKAKSTLSSVLNNQLDKLNELMKGNNSAENPEFDIDENELSEMDAIINSGDSSEFAVSASASASTNADFDEQDNLNNKYKEKLSRFNSSSMDDLKQKRKKISAILSLSDRKSKK